MPDDIVVFPNNVLIKVNYKKGENEYPLTTAFNTRKILEKIKKTIELLEKFDLKSVSLAEANGYDSIVLDTDVQIYKNYVLRRIEFSLSLALEVPIKKPFNYHFIDFVYCLSPQLGLQFGVR